MSPEELIESLICSGTVTQYGEIVRYDYDPMTRSTEGLDDGCFFCGATPIYLPKYQEGALHAASCPWVEAMRFLGHELPKGHEIAAAVSSESPQAPKADEA